MVYIKVYPPCLRINESRGSKALKTSTIKIFSIPMISPAEVTGGKIAVDWIESRDVGETVDRLFTNVFVTWVEATGGVVRLELLKPSGVAIVFWLEVDDNEEVEALNRIEKESELSVWPVKDVPEDIS